MPPAPPSPRGPGDRAPEPAPALVTLHVWGVPTRAVPLAVARMALDRVQVRRVPGLRFAKLLGTGDGRTFTARDADPHHWALLSTWRSAEDAAAFEDSVTARRWASLADERLRVELEPLSSRGRWSGREPFGSADGPARAAATRAAADHRGPVASITRARIRTARAARFWSAVPPVSADLHRVDGLRLALGIGEAPVGLQGTFSLWRSTDDLTAFAHRRPAHREAIRRTPRERWYAEELFARFAVRRVEGRFGGAEVRP